MPSRRDRPGWGRGAASGPQALPLFAAASETATVMQAPLVPEPVVALPAQSEGETVAED